MLASPSGAAILAWLAASPAPSALYTSADCPAVFGTFEDHVHNAEHREATLERITIREHSIDLTHAGPWVDPPETARVRDVDLVGVVAAGEVDPALIQAMLAGPHGIEGEGENENENENERGDEAEPPSGEDDGRGALGETGDDSTPSPTLPTLSTLPTLPDDALLAVFEVDPALWPQCPGGLYLVGADANLGPDARVLAVLDVGVLVEHQGSLAAVELPSARVPAWRMIYHPPIRIPRATSAAPAPAKRTPARRNNKRRR